MKKILLIFGVILIIAFSVLATYKSKINGQEIDANDGGYKVTLSEHDYWDGGAPPAGN